ncbi:MAG: putative zinc-binding metallopeptidase [Chitinophagaceae bacterium]|nr:putative zinc-binding metallopeptidase [Chitinophagaceae bacterium]
MKTLYALCWTALTIAGLVSCKKEENLDRPLPVGLGGQTWTSGPIDEWLMDSLTMPYNISVKYRWDPWELQLDRTYTPPEESKIIPAMSAIKRVWIDPYNEETGSDRFMKTYTPKQFVLVGSVQYDFGTVILGQAEGGNNIVFLDINQNFDKNYVTSLKRMIHTSHHEFAHILHQTIMYPQEFKTISSDLGLDGYTATWYNVTNKQALANGYVTPYSMASYDEDFVEMVSNMLVEGKTRFGELVASADEKAQQALRQKEQIVVNYFSQAYNIDFYSLQTRVQAALNKLVPPPTVEESYGFDKTYATASVNPANAALLPQSAPFLSAFNTSATAVAAIPNYGLTLDSLALITADATTAILRMYVRQGTTTFAADYVYDLSKDANGIYDLTYVSANGNGTIIATAVTPLLNYFENNQFGLSWYADPSVSIYPRVRFSSQSAPGSYFHALLLP